MSSTLIKEVIEHLEALPEDVQEQVLSLVRTLDSTTPRGVPGRELLKFAGIIPSSDLELMKQAIEQGRDQVDPDEW